MKPQATASKLQSAKPRSIKKRLKGMAQKLYAEQSFKQKQLTPPGKKSGLYITLFITILIIAVFGLLMILSASSHTALETTGSSWFWFRKQLLWFGLGVIALIAGLRIPYHFWGRLARPMLILSFILMLAVLIPKLGTSANGARRWLNFGFFTVQPAELSKLTLIIYLSFLLNSRKDRLQNVSLSIRPTMAIVGLFIFTLLIQPDLGSAIVLGSIAFSILFAVNVPRRSLGLWVIGAAASALLVSLSAGYRRKRLFSFLNPWEEPLDAGYQTLQSLVAVASGGFFGRGIGAGRAKWGYLPFSHTDFIFAVVAEELGLLGAGLLVIAFLILCIGGVMVALRSQDMLGTAIASGITGWLAAQFFLNVGAAMGMLPITGLTLPLVSYGGSSLIITMLALGILLNIARFSRIPTK